MCQTGRRTYGHGMAETTSTAAQPARFSPGTRLTASWRELRSLPRIDLGLAIVLIVLLDRPPYDPAGLIGGYWWTIYGTVAAASVAWRRVRPAAVWVITTVVGVLLIGPGRGFGPSAIAPLALPYGTLGGVSELVMLALPLIGLHALAASAGRRRSLLALAGSIVLVDGSVAWTVLGPRGVSTESGSLLIASVALLFGLAWVLGDNTRARSQATAALKERAAALEAERAERDLRAAAEERSRIARDMHDIVAHHISVIALQAGTARMLAESGRPPASELLSGIETTSRQAMTELRQAIGVIRHTEEGAAPLPGLGRLPELAFRMKEAGLSVVVEGSAGELPGGLDLAAYRVVQEGLTNVVRHSQAQAATVTLRRGGAKLEIVVSDDGPARPSDTLAGGGHGLAGLGERVRGYGGQLSARMREDGGFELLAELPTEGPDLDRTGEGWENPAAGGPVPGGTGTGTDAPA
jgi:signal transduction histidine kinase